MAGGIRTLQGSLQQRVGSALRAGQSARRHRYWLADHIAMESIASYYGHAIVLLSYTATLACPSC